MKNSSDTTENRTCDIPACNAVTQPTAAPACSILNQNKRNLAHGGLEQRGVLHCLRHEQYLR